MILEEETELSNDSGKKAPPTRIIYKIEPIPEIDGSDNNSMTFQ